MSTTARTKFAAQDAILQAIVDASKKHADAAVGAEMNIIGRKLAERWGVRNYPAGSAQ